jgi:hypothetical protein
MQTTEPQGKKGSIILKNKEDKLKETLIETIILGTTISYEQQLDIEFKKTF